MFDWYDYSSFFCCCVLIFRPRSVSFFLFRTSFSYLRYLNSEMIRAVINFDNVAAADRERRGEPSDAHSARPYSLWKDNDNVENSSLHQNSWAISMCKLY
jgi:hypothetical protein